MPTTQITVTAFQTAVAECADAITSGDWGTARTKYALAEAINAGLDLGVQHDQSSFTRRENLAGLRKAIEYAETTARGRSDRRRLISTKMGYSS